MKDQEFIVQKIRSQYTEEAHTGLDTLKALDAKAKRPANLFGWLFGSPGAIVMGTGMRLVMTDLGPMLGVTETLVTGIALGLVGLVMCCVTYPIYRRLLTSRKKRYASQILELSEQVMTH